MRGVTVLEMLWTVVLVGFLTALVIPGGKAVRDRLLVERQAAAVVDLYREGRLVALGSPSGARISLSPLRHELWRVGLVDSTLVRTVPGPALEGVQLMGGSAPIRFAPNGLTQGVANVTIVLERGTVRRAVIVSRPGRIRFDRNP